MGVCVCGILCVCVCECVCVCGYLSGGGGPAGLAAVAVCGGVLHRVRRGGGVTAATHTQAATVVLLALDTHTHV